MKLIEPLFRLPLLRRVEFPPIVPVLRLSGAIGSGGAFRKGLTLESLAGPIEQAFSMPKIKAVALVVNSPGGSPVQSALIARRIRDFAEEKQVKVYAFCEDVAASGGYWLACAADEIYCMDSSIVGSIGVVSAGFGFPDLMQRYGVERRVYTSGEKKVILDPFKEEDPDDVELLKSIQSEVHADFKDMVRTRRRDRLKGDEDTLFSGRFWTGKTACELGLVDGVGELRHTLRGIYGTKLKLKPISAKKPLLQRMSGGTAATGPVLPKDWAGDLMAAVEERALWQRFGL